MNLSFRKIALNLLRFLFAGAVLWVINTIWYKPFDINHFFERILLEYALHKPEELSRYKALDPYLSFYNSQLNPVQQPADSLDLLVKKLNLLTSYKRNELNPEQRLSSQILERIIENMMKDGIYARHDYAVNHLSGIHIDFPYFMITYHEIDDVEDAEQYIERLSAFDEKARAIIEKLEYRQNQGLFPPKYVVENVLTQIKAIRSKDPRKNVLYLDFVSKTDSLENLSALVRGELHYSCKKMIEDVVYPSLHKLSNHFEEVNSSYPEDVHGEGIWRFPDGEGYYTSLLVRYTGADESDLYPDELKQTALDDYIFCSEKLQNYIDSVVAPGKKTKAREFIRTLYATPAYVYTNTDNGRLAYLDALRSFTKKINAKSRFIFGVGPENGPEIGRMQAFREKYGPPSEYQKSDLDNKRASKYLLNLKEMSLYRKFMIPTECFTELYPGRHYLSYLQTKMPETPTFRKIANFPTYTEGWKLYALQLAEENDFFTDSVAYLGKLHYEQIQAGLLVADNSIHFGRWNKAEAVGFLVDKIGVPPVYADHLINDIVLNPGKAWSGKYGLLNFLRLRKMTEKRLGKRFDYVDYHRFLLGKGPMPFDILEKEIKIYVDQKLKAG